MRAGDRAGVSICQRPGSPCQGGNEFGDRLGYLGRQEPAVGPHVSIAPKVGREPMDVNPGCGRLRGVKLQAKAATIPARTSPAPAVASAGLPLVLMSKGSDPSATMVCAPLRITVARARVARARAAPTRSRSIASAVVSKETRRFSRVRSQDDRPPS